MGWGRSRHACDTQYRIVCNFAGSEMNGSLQDLSVLLAAQLALCPGLHQVLHTTRCCFLQVCIALLSTLVGQTIALGGLSCPVKSRWPSGAGWVVGCAWGRRYLLLVTPPHSKNFFGPLP